MTFEANVLEQFAMAHNRIDTVGSTRQQFLSECLAELGEKDRELILSRYETGVTVGELATQASCNVKSLYNALARIRQGLARCVREKITREKGGSA
jgi:DNA-directed RNA polymerase specialized sigma24 family protein